MRACIAGGGLAGSLLAWRLAAAEPGRSVELVPGPSGSPGPPGLPGRPGGSPGRPGGSLGRTGGSPGAAVRADATGWSGGAVRAYEEDAEQRRLAIAGMVELLGSRTLRDWAGYVRADSVYLRRDAAGLDAAATDVEQLLPGSVELLDAAGLTRLGWADVHPGAAAVRERAAGFYSPDRLRSAILADATRRGVTVRPGTVRTLDGTTVDGRAYDVVVLATGPWTPRLLRSWDLPADGWRTKSIQYAVHAAGEWLPPAFVDGVTGLYGRPAAGGGVLLGLPTDLWDVDPDAPPVTPELGESAVRLAATRFPRLRLGPAAPQVGATDCYRESGGLTLRRVLPGVPLFTFSGGSGGSAKTALAASARAALQLADPGSLPAPQPVGREEGQR